MRERTGYDVADYVGARPDPLTEARKAREAQEATATERALDLYALGSAGIKTLRAFVCGTSHVSTEQAKEAVRNVQRAVRGSALRADNYKGLLKNAKALIKEESR